jgi:type I restriction enzyme S subunit
MSAEDRLDFSYWHPKFEHLIEVLASGKFVIKELTSVLRSPIISGKTPENYVYPMDGVLFIGARNVKNGKVDLNDVTYIEESIHEGMLKSSKVVAGDVLATMAGAVGRTAIYTDPKEANINQAVARLQPDFDQIDPQYLVYYLSSSFGQLQFERNRHDVNQPNINTSEMGRIKVILPPKRKLQDEIVNKLSELENRITSHIIKQKEVLQELQNVIPNELGLTLPSLNYDYYSKPVEALGEASDSRLDFIWNQPSTNLIRQYLKSKNAVPLGNLVENKIEYGLNAYGKEEGKTAFVNVENLGIDGLIHSEGIRYVDDVPESKLLKENELLISRSRTVGICAIISKKEERYSFGSYILRLKVKSDVKVSPLYIASFINSEIGQAQIIYLQTGSREAVKGGGNNINPDQLKQLLIVLPKTSEQETAIVDNIKKLLNIRKDMEIQKKEMIETFSQAFESFLMAL